MNQDDHDLLIRVDTKVDGLFKEMTNIRTDVLNRVVNLENTRATKDDLAKLFGDFSIHQTDMEKRMRQTERFMYIALGITAVIQLIGVPLLLKFFT